VLVAQAPAQPTLSEVQRLTVLTAVQRFEIAQLRAQAAQKELEGLLKSLEKPGYTFELQTMTYLKAVPSPPSK
jgi:hypothetical protein